MSWLNHLLLFTDNGLSSFPRNIIIMNDCGLKRRVCGEQTFLRYLNAFFSSHYVHRNKIRTFSLFGLSNDLMNTPNMKFLHPVEFESSNLIFNFCDNEKISVFLLLF